MTSAASVAPKHDEWLSQGDIFERLLFVRAGVADGQAISSLDHSPAMLISHGCAIDKKNKGRSRLEYLTFLPLQSVAALESENSDRANLLRAKADDLLPYEAMYLGDVPQVGESYVMLTQPYTLPAALLRTELKSFTAEQTGDKAEQRVIPTIWDSRVASLSDLGLELFQRKWTAQWTRRTFE